MEIFYTDTAIRQLKSLERDIRDHIIKRYICTLPSRTRSNSPNHLLALRHIVFESATIAWCSNASNT